MVRTKVVPGVIIAPVPKVPTVIEPKLANVVGLAKTFEAVVIPLKVKFSRLPPLPKVTEFDPLPVQLEHVKPPLVEKVTLPARAAEGAISATPAKTRATNKVLKRFAISNSFCLFLSKLVGLDTRTRFMNAD
jgi:hypothetical protein